VNDVESRIGPLLDAALDQPSDRRLAWVDGLDASHDALKPRLRALLSRAPEIESRDFLGSLPVFDGTDPGDEETFASAAAGERVGPYQLQRPLGAGGMGSVWLATRADGLFERSIALKLPHRGMFGADLAERMARERGILAGLDHPHIARLYDAGLTTDGQPYLALEYVEGDAIDEYCRRLGCDLRERLRLFLQVADAVASAHARLVVHRDLKPANIIVGKDGNVRLLDFGIAKLLDAQLPGEAPLTQLSVQAMTPDYASPEQIQGEPVTTASDVYSLGVVLYELLTGERPYRLRRGTRGALEDAILQCDPRRPSDMPTPSSRALRGDLDTIVLKALRKKAAERYATVNAFADDVRRHLEGRPVLARPDSAWYRASRFVRRNRLAVATAGIVAVALVTAAIVASVGLVHARAAERRALADAEITRQVSRFLVDVFNVSDPGEARGNSITAREILDKASSRVMTELSTAPAVRAALLATMADVYAKLGLYDDALKLGQSALELRRAESPGSPGALDLATSLDQVGETLSSLRRGKDAIPLHEQSIALRRRAEPVDPVAASRALLHLAVAHYVEEDFDRTLAVLHEARGELAKDPQPHPELLGEITKYLASVRQEKGELVQSIGLYQDALVLLRAGLGEDHPIVAGAHGDLAIALKDAGRYDEAETAYLDSLAIQRRVLGPRHPDVGNALNNLTVMYMDVGKFDRALASAQEGTDILRASLGDGHDTTNVMRLNLARVHTQLGHLDVAEGQFRAIVALRREVGSTDNIAFASTMDALADVLNKQGEFSEAHSFAREARAAMEIAIGKEHWRWAGVNRTLGVSLTGLGRYAEAEPLLLDSYRLMNARRGESHRQTQLTAKRIVEMYTGWNRPAKVREWRVRAGK
jgi:serine/threonine-protein kinase